jgi:chromosome segregation ATPase
VITSLEEKLLQTVSDLQKRLAEAETARDEFERKGKDLCCAYGNALVEVHDLKRKIASMEENAYELISERTKAHLKEAEEQLKSERDRRVKAEELLRRVAAELKAWRTDSIAWAMVREIDAHFAAYEEMKS